MNEVVLQVDCQKRRAREIPCFRIAHVASSAGSMIVLPNRSTRPRKCGSIRTVVSGCVRIAGPSMTVPTGSESRS